VWIVERYANARSGNHSFFVWNVVLVGCMDISFSVSFPPWNFWGELRYVGSRWRKAFPVTAAPYGAVVQGRADLIWQLLGKMGYY
jgi:hypothetical protein